MRGQEEGGDNPEVKQARNILSFVGISFKKNSNSRRICMRFVRETHHESMPAVAAAAAAAKDKDKSSASVVEASSSNKSHLHRRAQFLLDGGRKVLGFDNRYIERELS